MRIHRMILTAVLLKIALHVHQVDATGVALPVGPREPGSPSTGSETPLTISNNVDLKNKVDRSHVEQLIEKDQDLISGILKILRSMNRSYNDTQDLKKSLSGKDNKELKTRISDHCDKQQAIMRSFKHIDLYEDDGMHIKKLERFYNGMKAFAKFSYAVVCCYVGIHACYISKDTFHYIKELSPSLGEFQNIYESAKEFLTGIKGKDGKAEEGLAVGRQALLLGDSGSLKKGDVVVIKKIIDKKNVQVEHTVKTPANELIPGVIARLNTNFNTLGKNYCVTVREIAGNLVKVEFNGTTHDNVPESKLVPMYTVTKTDSSVETKYLESFIKEDDIKGCEALMNALDYRVKMDHKSMWGGDSKPYQAIQDLIGTLTQTYLKLNFLCLSEGERARLLQLRWYLENVVMQERTIPPEGVVMKAGNCPKNSDEKRGVHRTYVKRFVFVAEPIIKDKKIQGITKDNNLNQHHDDMIKTALKENVGAIFMAMSRNTKRSSTCTAKNGKDTDEAIKPIVGVVQLKKFKQLYHIKEQGLHYCQRNKLNKLFKKFNNYNVTVYHLGHSKMKDENSKKWIKTEDWQTVPEISKHLVSGKEGIYKSEDIKSVIPEKLLKGSTADLPSTIKRKQRNSTDSNDSSEDVSMESVDFATTRTNCTRVSSMSSIAEETDGKNSTGQSEVPEDKPVVSEGLKRKLSDNNYKVLKTLADAVNSAKTLGDVIIPASVLAEKAEEILLQRSSLKSLELTAFVTKCAIFLELLIHNFTKQASKDGNHWKGKPDPCDDYPVFMRAPPVYEQLSDKFQKRNPLHTLQWCKDTFTKAGTSQTTLVNDFMVEANANIGKVVDHINRNRKDSLKKSNDLFASINLVLKQVGQLKKQLGKANKKIQTMNHWAVNQDWTVKSLEGARKRDLTNHDLARKRDLAKHDLEMNTLRKICKVDFDKIHKYIEKETVVKAHWPVGKTGEKSSKQADCHIIKYDPDRKGTDNTVNVKFIGDGHPAWIKVGWVSIPLTLKEQAELGIKPPSNRRDSQPASNRRDSRRPVHQPLSAREQSKFFRKNGIRNVRRSSSRSNYASAIGK